MNTPRSFNDLTDGTITLKNGSSVSYWALCTRAAPEAIRVALNIKSTSPHELKERGVAKITFGRNTLFDFTNPKPHRSHFDQRPVTKDHSRHPFAGAPAFA